MFYVRCEPSPFQCPTPGRVVQRGAGSDSGGECTEDVEPCAWEHPGGQSPGTGDSRAGSARATDAHLDAGEPPSAGRDNPAGSGSSPSDMLAPRNRFIYQPAAAGP